MMWISKSILKYIIVGISIIVLAIASFFIYRAIFPIKPPVSAVAIALEKIDGKLDQMDSKIKEARQNVYIRTKDIETAVSALAPDDVASELAVLLEQSRSERRNTVRPSGLE